MHELRHLPAVLSMTFSDRLKTAMGKLPPIDVREGRGRKPSRVTQLAKLAAIDYSAMRKIVVNGERPGKKRVERIAKACGVEANWLFYG